MVNSQILQDLADRIVSDNAVLFRGSELFAGPGEGVAPPGKPGIARVLAERFEYGKDDYSLPAVVCDYDEDDITIRAWDGTGTAGWRFFPVTGVLVANDSAAHAAL